MIMCVLSFDYNTLGSIACKFSFEYHEFNSYSSIYKKKIYKFHLSHKTNVNMTDNNNYVFKMATEDKQARVARRLARQTEKPLFSFNNPFSSIFTVIILYLPFTK